MRYVMLIYANESDSPERGTPEAAAVLAQYHAFTEDVKVRGIYQTGEPLQPSSTATTIRVRDGERLMTDGPYAETREQLGGFYILDCKDLDEALDCAAKIPGALSGAIEVRPIMELG